MRELVYTQSAKEDLLAILDYIPRESGNVVVGLQFTTQLRQQCSKLSTLPGTLGRARPELRLDIRSFAFKSHVIFFVTFPKSWKSSTFSKATGILKAISLGKSLEFCKVMIV